MGALGILFLAAGAILTFALDIGVEGVDVDTIGIILMIVGGIGVLVGAAQGTLFGFRTRSRRTVSADGRDVVEEQRTTGL